MDFEKKYFTKCIQVGLKHLLAKATRFNQICFKVTDPMLNKDRPHFNYKEERAMIPAVQEFES